MITIIGIPAPQGSKNPFGGEANPNTKPWRATVAAAANDSNIFHDPDGTSGYLPVLDTPVKLTARFYFPRPKSHYRTGKHAHVLKDTAPAYHATKPDLDKLQRAIGDALTGVLIRDDSQIVHWDAVKLYGEPARCELEISAPERIVFEADTA